MVEETYLFWAISYPTIDAIKKVMAGTRLAMALAIDEVAKYKPS